MNQRPAAVPHRVAVVAQDHVYPFELGIPSRIFGASGAGYDVQICTASGGPIRTNAGFSVTPDHGPEFVTQADTVIVAPIDSPHLERAGDPQVIELLSQLKPTTRLVSICTGVFALAAAGLLDGRKAATHWECAPIFRSWYPQVQLEENVLFLHDDGVHTSAGAAAGIDLCLDLLRQDHGSRVAAIAARRCIVPPFREGGQAQFIDRPVPDSAHLSTGPARDWALQHLDITITVADLARFAHMSERTLVRRFLEETGTAPRRWLTRQRLGRARELLEDTDLSIDEIAATVGYATSTSLRRHLESTLGMVPSAYRRTFRRPGSPAAASTT